MVRKKFIKLYRYLFFMAFLCIILGIKCNASAATARLLVINGGDSDSANTFLYSASMFYDCMDGFYINGIKVKKSDCHYMDNPSYSVLDREIDYAFSGSKDNDILLFYYSGHGTMSNGHAGMYTSDGRNYEFSHLYSKLKKVKGKKLVILDCCYSGSFITQNAIDKTKFSVITACKHNSYSPFFNKLNILTFFSGRRVTITHFSDKVLEGLGYYDNSLKADADKNKTVTLKELFQYLQKNYQKTYCAEYDNKTIKFEAVPQRYGNINFTFSKSAVQSAAKITLNKTNASLYISEKLQLKATVVGDSQKVTWISSDPSVVAVNSNGKIKALKEGITTITAKANGKTAICKIKVKKPAIKLNKTKVTLDIPNKTTIQLKVKVKGPSQKVKWKSSNEKIATVSSSGKVTAKKAGKVTIGVKANGVTSKCQITVKNFKQTNPIIDISMYLGKNLKKAAALLGVTTYSPWNGEDQYIKYDSHKDVLTNFAGDSKENKFTLCYNKDPNILAWDVKVGSKVNSAISKLKAKGFIVREQSSSYIHLKKSDGFYVILDIENDKITSINAGLSL